MMRLLLNLTYLAQAIRTCCSCSRVILPSHERLRHFAWENARPRSSRSTPRHLPHPSSPGVCQARLNGAPVQRDPPFTGRLTPISPVLPSSSRPTIPLPRLIPGRSAGAWLHRHQLGPSPPILVHGHTTIRHNTTIPPSRTSPLRRTHLPGIAPPLRRTPRRTSPPRVHVVSLRISAGSPLRRPPTPCQTPPLRIPAPRTNPADPAFPRPTRTCASLC
jgi:hypothetical protein